MTNSFFFFSDNKNDKIADNNLFCDYFGCETRNTNCDITLDAFDSMDDPYYELEEYLEKVKVSKIPTCEIYFIVCFCGFDYIINNFGNKFSRDSSIWLTESIQPMVSPSSAGLHKKILR